MQYDFYPIYLQYTKKYVTWKTHEKNIFSASSTGSLFYF